MSTIHETPAPVQIKICGVTCIDDARAAIDMGADMLGFVCAPASPRRVTVEQIQHITRDLGDRPDGAPRVVAVVADTPHDEVARLANSDCVDAVQISDIDDARALDMLRVVRAGNAQIEVIRVCHVAAHGNIDHHERARRWSTKHGATILFDAQGPHRAAGGSGTRVDAELLDPSFVRERCGIAGGLTPETVGALVTRLQPAFVDVSSGVEAAPGHKSAHLMRAFVRAVRARSAYQLDALDMPASDGRYGEFGGSYIPEVLVPAIERLTTQYLSLRRDRSFHAEFGEYCRTFVGRPTPLQHAPRLTQHAGGARIMLKREDLAHTGSHKINNAIGQALIAKRLGLTRIIAETGAGQHGVATATACAMLGLDCTVYMGAHDVERQHPNVERMQLLGAEVRSVEEGARTLKDAINAAIRDWVTNVRDTYYLIGSAVGMHPYPLMVRDFQSVIGHEIRAQSLEHLGALPDTLVACVGGGSNAIGTFAPSVADESIELWGAEAGGRGPDPGDHGASISCGTPGVLHGAHTMLVQDGHGQVAATHSISAGLDYPGVGPEHAQLAASGRATYTAIDDAAAMAALRLTCRLEGIIPALESAHAIALGLNLAAQRPATDTIVVTVSGRGDKDMAAIMTAKEALT